MASKTRDSSVADYHAWRKAVMRDEKLKKLATARQAKDIRITAYAIAEYGANGRGCFPSLETLADTTGFSLSTVKRHRHELVNEGWFTTRDRDGLAKGKRVTLDRAMPYRGPCCSECGSPTAPVYAIDGISVVSYECSQFAWHIDFPNMVHQVTHGSPN